MPSSSDQFRVYLLFIPLFILDASIATWDYFNISIRLIPIDHQRLIDPRGRWSTFVVLNNLVNCAALVLNATWFVMFAKTILTKAKGPSRLVVYPAWVVLGVFVAVGCLIAPWIAEPIAWRRQFRDSCNGFDLRVNLNLDSLFFQHKPTMKNFTMTFSPDPGEQIVQTYVFHVDPVYSPPLPDFYPSYDSITYNFSARTYTIKSSNSTILRTGLFAFAPVLHVPDLNVSADVFPFARNDIYRPFLKIYDSTAPKDINTRKHAWSDNAHVMMRTARFSSTTDVLSLCARSQNADVVGLGELSPVVVGLVALLKSPKGLDYTAWDLATNVAK